MTIPKAMEMRINILYTGHQLHTFKLQNMEMKHSFFVVWQDLSPFSTFVFNLSNKFLRVYCTIFELHLDLQILDIEGRFIVLNIP